MTWNILVSDPLSSDALERLAAAPEVRCEQLSGKEPARLLEALPHIDAWIIRSGTKVTAELLEAASRLQCIARAGVGVDNVDIEAATRRGVLVMNTPFGNTISAAEHTLAMLFAVCRNLPQACASLKAGHWERKAFVGRELTGKTLGVVGLGKIGQAVAERAQGLKMQVIGFDPFVESADFEVVSLAEIYRRADVISVHVPINDRTRGMIGSAELQACKPGVIILNCARGGVVSEEALIEALEQGALGGVGLDVFEREPLDSEHPLLRFPQVVLTPHLGASTLEAQDKVGLAAVQEVLDYLQHGAVRNAVNMPSLDAAVGERLAPFVLLAEKIGSLHGQLARGKIAEVQVRFSGEAFGEDGRELCTRAVLQGLLQCFLDGPVNRISARTLAKGRGIAVGISEQSSRDFSAVLDVHVRGSFGSRRIAGALFGQKFPRLIRFDDYRTDAIPEGCLLLVQNRDQPRMLARISALIGDSGINIANVTLARDTSGGTALALFNLDSHPSGPQLEALRAIPDVQWACACDLGA